MKVNKRREAMLEAVLHGMTDVSALCSHFGMSEATVRRDLAALASDRRIFRTYGGATAVGAYEHEPSLDERSHSWRDEKEAIALAAFAHITDGDTIYLDGGTTTAALARHLPLRSSLHVVTNNLLVLASLAGSGIHVTVIGGDLRPSSMSTMGPLAQMALSRISVNKAFLGADGVVAGLGLCEASAEQAYLKECVIRQAAQVFVLAASDKIGRASQQHWTPIDRDWTLITDVGTPDSERVPFEALDDVCMEVVAVQSAVGSTSATSNRAIGTPDPAPHA